MTTIALQFKPTAASSAASLSLRVARVYLVAAEAAALTERATKPLQDKDIATDGAPGRSAPAHSAKLPGAARQILHDGGLDISLVPEVKRIAVIFRVPARGKYHTDTSAILCTLHGAAPFSRQRGWPVRTEASRNRLLSTKKRVGTDS